MSFKLASTEQESASRNGCRRLGRRASRKVPLWRTMSNLAKTEALYHCQHMRFRSKYPVAYGGTYRTHVLTGHTRRTSEPRSIFTLQIPMLHLAFLLGSPFASQGIIQLITCILVTHTIPGIRNPCKEESRSRGRGYPCKVPLILRGARLKKGRSSIRMPLCLCIQQELREELAQVCAEKGLREEAGLIGGFVLLIRFAVECDQPPCIGACKGSMFVHVRKQAGLRGWFCFFTMNLWLYTWHLL